MYLTGYFRDHATVVMKKPMQKSRLLFYLKPLSYVVSNVLITYTVYVLHTNIILYIKYI